MIGIAELIHRGGLYISVLVFGGWCYAAILILVALYHFFVYIFRKIRNTLQ